MKLYKAFWFCVMRNWVCNSFLLCVYGSGVLLLGTVMYGVELVRSERLNPGVLFSSSSGRCVRPDSRISVAAQDAEKVCICSIGKDCCLSLGIVMLDSSSAVFFMRTRGTDW